MNNKYQELTRAFESLAIDPATFKHIDHVGVAFVMLQKYDFITTAYKYSKCLDAIATRAGAPEKFRVTTTLAFLSLIAEKMNQSVHTNAVAFMDEHQELLSPKVLSDLYSSARLQSDDARTTFLLPDRSLSTKAC